MADTDAPLPFQLRKLGHVVLNVTDLERSVRFYTELLGLAVSDRYPDTMVPGGMVFMRCNADHHGVALVGGARPNGASSLNHFAFEVATLDEVFRARAWLRKHAVPIVFEGRRRAVVARRIRQAVPERVVHAVHFVRGDVGGRSADEVAIVEVGPRESPVPGTVDGVAARRPRAARGPPAPAGRCASGRRPTARGRCGSRPRRAGGRRPGSGRASRPGRRRRPR